MAETSKCSNLIKIHMINNKGYIWSAEDWFILRTQHRILGSLVGALPIFPRQEDQNGLPSILLPEEVRLIVENGIGCTFDVLNYDGISKDYDEKHLNELLKEFVQQKANYINNLRVKSLLFEKGENFRKKKLNKVVTNITPIDKSTYVMIHIDEDCKKEINIPLLELIEGLEKLRYKVFKDFWSKGYYLTCGLKFGGDFLVYEGDPLANHSQYIVLCRELGKNICSYARICSMTKKKLVVARDDGDTINYLLCILDETSMDFSNTKINFAII